MSCRWEQRPAGGTAFVHCVTGLDLTTQRLVALYGETHSCWVVKALHKYVTLGSVRHYQEFAYVSWKNVRSPARPRHANGGENKRRSSGSHPQL